ncbi:MAG: permease-like cell division protein FtsX [Crocinitomicaceae bacterium]|nr:permease-like cell division protein FtsX [Crocinitomicaceae bacterium]
MARKATKGTRAAYIATIVGIVLVLFIVGVVSWFALGLNHLRETRIESFEVDLFFENDVNQTDLIIIEEEIAQKNYVNSAKYRSADEAWNIIKEDVGGDSALFVLDNENPLYQSIILTLKTDYFHKDSMKIIKSELEAEYGERLLEVSYPEEIFAEYNSNLKKGMYFVLLLAIMLLFTAIAMINNTIRLALFSRRFIIKTMQLVGATPRFIRKPFIRNAIAQGFISGLIAGCMVLGFIMILERYNTVFLEMTDMKLFTIVLAGIMLFGILITVTSTYFALRKYLRKNLESLY